MSPCHPENAQLDRIFRCRYNPPSSANLPRSNRIRQVRWSRKESADSTAKRTVAWQAEQGGFCSLPSELAPTFREDRYNGLSRRISYPPPETNRQTDSTT